MPSFYEVLGISRSADIATITAAYHRLALRWNPDQNRDNLDGAKLKLKAIQRSYDVLSDANKRAE